MPATILQFPLIDGACCVIEPRRNPHRNKQQPVDGCLCDACEGRREELKLASKLEVELLRARNQRELDEHRTSILERDAG